MDKIRKSDAEWQQALSPEQYAVMRKKATERPFTGKYVDNHEQGMYRCASCGNPLFESDTKYDSGSGWPSFTAPVGKENVEMHHDRSHFMERTEVVCAKSDAHLGHVFPDGPGPEGLRYCINSCSLDFKKGEK
jgi:peptide-methionine (R)-S-oxide reductase